MYSLNLFICNVIRIEPTIKKPEIFTKSFLVFLFLYPSLLFGSPQILQDREVKSSVSFYSTFTGQKHQNFWLTSNRGGMFREDGPNAFSLLSAEIPFRKNSLIDWSAGADLLLRATHSGDAYFHQGWLEGKAGPVNITAGRKEMVIGMNPHDLSSGSMAMSNNARPVTGINIYTPQFFDVPFSFGWLEIKGHMFNGRLGDERYVKKPMFHSKSFYAQTGADTGFKFYWGIGHLAIWGGDSPLHGSLPSGIGDFFKVFVANAGDEDAPANEVNALGFHSGIYEWGLKLNLKYFDLHLYYQHIFTDRSGMGYKNFGDGIWGLSFHNNNNQSPISGITYEVINTRNQSGMGLSDRVPGYWPDFCDEPNCGFPFGGRDNYYNNSIYRSGLSFFGLSMGSPLFLTRSQLDKVEKYMETFDNDYFVSTRNLAHHLGVMGSISPQINYKILTTYIQYYGTYWGKNLGTIWGSLDPTMNPKDYYFNPSRNQWYFMLETKWSPRFSRNISIHTSIAIDSGDLFNTLGAMGGVSWSFF